MTPVIDDPVQWARTASRHTSRPCETCAFFRGNPKAAEWYAAVLREKEAGRSSVSWVLLRNALAERFGYPLVTGSLFGHHQRQGSGGCDVRRC